MTAHPLRERLVDGVQALGLSLTDLQIQQLLDYLDLLGKWNKVYNLTALREPAEMLTHHLFDSLAVIGPLHRHTQGRATRLLDVGSGGGLPGVVIAICRPEVEVACVDAVAKKAVFVQQCAGALGLPNLRGLHARVERVADRFDVVASRAFAALPDFVEWSRHALVPGGRWLAMKGKYPADEIAALPPWARLDEVEPITVPGLDADRCLIWLRSEAT